MGLYTSGRTAKPMTPAQFELLRYGSNLMRELYPDPDAAIDPAREG